MPTCKSCNAKVLRTDAFCGTCGEQVPGAKPVVPIARQATPSGVQSTADRITGAFPPPAATGASARAMAVVALSDPDEPEPPSAEPNQTGIREREQSEPAPVLPLQRRKDATSSQREVVETVVEPPPAETPPSMPERDTSLPNVPVPAGPPTLSSSVSVLRAPLPD